VQAFIVIQAKTVKLSEFNFFLSLLLQFSVGLDGKKLEPESNVLLASIENMQYAVTLDVLHMVFAFFITVPEICSSPSHPHC
jgi:hypothetical protein